MNGRKGQAQGWVATLVIVLTMGTAWGQAVKPVAVVNGQAISEAELDAVLKHVPPSPTPLTEAQRLQMKQEALDMLIRDVIQRQFLEHEFRGKPTLKPNGPEVNKHMAELVTALKQKNLTIEQFLKESGQTEAELRAGMAKELLWQAFLSSRISDEYLKRYYLAYKPFFDKVVVRASHILIRIPQAAKDIERQVARNKLRALRQDIVAGKMDFAEAAKKYSECPSKDNGGDLGYFPRKFVVLEAFAQAAFALNVGQISDVVETDYGVHLIKVVDRKPGEPSDFEKIKNEVRQTCMMELGEQILNQVQKAAKVEVYLH
jgi:parvulin-like peptidyl-prolyl isomerase